ncbi:hypothetical protein O998_02865 [Anaplasma phagocytophilum str. Norway variant1]|uniref:Uncharacterized protein n=1 Tax=Anaplasma phagocytophilum str. Norway variant1 TaxID=1392506 RepID=A0A7H9DYU3_ANAPH|nr:hypothetical protein O998_02865 [Anaplasma phagocytophilum str. Norway variant1]
MAASIGAGLPVSNIEGLMIVDTGSGITEVAITSISFLAYWLRQSV